MNISDIKHWLKNNLFSNWYYSLISLFIFYLLLITLPPFLDWALIKATFIGNSKTDCQPGGANAQLSKIDKCGNKLNC